MIVHVGGPMAFHEAITFGLAIGTSQTIPQREILAVVIVEVEVMHGMTRSIVDHLGPSHVLGIV